MLTGYYNSETVSLTNNNKPLEGLIMSEYKFKTCDIKGKKYVTVNERVKYFRTAPEYKDYSIEVSIERLTLDSPDSPDQCLMVAVIKNEKGRVISTGRSWEVRDSSFINKTSFVENCETSAIGRCLAFMGIGIDTSIATFEEVMTAQAAQKTIDTSGLVPNGNSPQPSKEELVNLAARIPSNPPTNAGQVNTEGVVIPFGKFKGKKVTDIEPITLAGWWKWLSNTDFDRERNMKLVTAVEAVLGGK